MRHFLFVLFVLSLVFEGKAQQIASTFHFLELPATTKSLALGGVTTTVIANDMALALESPALFGKEQDGQLSLSYMNYWANAHAGTATYGRAWGERGAWAIGARFISYGKLDGYTADGFSTGSFSAKDIMLQASYSYELSDYLRAGISFKGIYSAIESYTAWGIGTDLAINYFSQNKERSLGMAITNIGAMLRPYSSTREALPWDIRVGYSQKLAHAPFQIHITAYHLRRQPDYELSPELGTMGKVLRHIALGVEFVPSNKLWIGLGYNPRIAQNMKHLTGGRLGGLSMGMGIDRAGYRVSVAATAYNSSFWAVMLNLGTDFGLINL